MGMSDLLVPCMILVYKHAYMYWFAQGLLGIWWTGFLYITVEIFPIHYCELFIINDCIEVRSMFMHKL